MRHQPCQAAVDQPLKLVVRASVLLHQRQRHHRGRRGQRRRDLLSDVKRFTQLQGSDGDALSQSLTFNEFGGDVMTAISLADLKNSKNIRMVQRGRGPRLLLETTETFLVLRKDARQDLERDFATEFGIPGKIYFAHTATA